MENRFSTASVIFIVLLIVALLVAVLVFARNTDETASGSVVAPTPDPNTVYIFDADQQAAIQPIACSCETITPTLVGNMDDFSSDDWGGAVLTYRADNNTIYVGANGDTESRMSIFPIPLDDFDFETPTINGMVDDLAADIPVSDTLIGFAWNPTDQVFYGGRDNGILHSLAPGSTTWNIVANEFVYDEGVRGYAVLDNGNMLVVDSPSNGGNNVYEVDPNSGDDPITPISTTALTIGTDDLSGITAIARAPDGTIWMAVRPLIYNGSDPTPIFVYTPGQTALVPTCYVNTERVISAMTFDGNGRLWLMTGGNDDTPNDIYFISPPPCPDEVVP